VAEWISVYNRRPVELDAAALRRSLDDADLWTLAETLDIPEDEVDAAVRQLRVEATGGRIEVHWKPSGRPIQISAVDGSRAQGEVTETLDVRLPVLNSPGLARVREHLGGCAQIVHLEMGIDDARHLGATLGEVLAFSVATAGDGLIWFFDQAWAAPDNPAATIWTP